MNSFGGVLVKFRNPRWRTNMADVWKPWRNSRVMWRHQLMMRASKETILDVLYSMWPLDRTKKTRTCISYRRRTVTNWNLSCNLTLTLTSCWHHILSHILQCVVLTAFHTFLNIFSLAVSWNRCICHLLCHLPESVVSKRAPPCLIWNVEVWEPVPANTYKQRIS